MMETLKTNNLYIFRSIRKLLLVSVIVLIFNCCDKDDSDSDTSSVTITSISPESPASLSFGQRVTIIYDYTVVEPEGVRIWVMPYTMGAISPAYSYTSSPLIKGTGSRTVGFSITSGDSTVVDQIRIKIATANGQETISEFNEEVAYTFTD